MFKFFKKNNKTILIDLEKAKKDGLITEEKFLELKLKRAEKELKTFLASKK